MVPLEYLKSKDVEFEISGKADGSITIQLLFRKSSFRCNLLQLRLNSLSQCISYLGDSEYVSVSEKIV